MDKEPAALEMATLVSMTTLPPPQRGRPVKLWIQEAVDESTGLCKYCQKPAPRNNTTKVKRVGQ